MVLTISCSFQSKPRCRASRAYSFLLGEPSLVRTPTSLLLYDYGSTLSILPTVTCIQPVAKAQSPSTLCSTPYGGHTASGLPNSGSEARFSTTSSTSGCVAVLACFADHNTSLCFEDHPKADFHVYNSNKQCYYASKDVLVWL